MLTGSLDDFTLSDILRFLATCSRTGSVRVRRPGGDGEVFFRSGEVCFAASGSTVGSRTSENSEEDLKHKIADAVFDLLRGDEGEFDWDPNRETDVPGSLTLGVESLITEASRKLEELEVIEQKIPSEAAVLAMAPTPPEGAAEISISPDEWRILVLIDGRRTVTDIAAAVGLDSFAVMRTLYALATAGLIVVTDALPQSTPEPVVEPVATADPEPEPEAEAAPEPKPAIEPEAEATPELEPEIEPAADEPTPEAEGNPFDIEPAGLPQELPVSADAGTQHEAVVDRVAAVRELADLFSPGDGVEGYDAPSRDDDEETQLNASVVAGTTNGDGRRRVEEDEEITQGLISRLITGVKGL